MKAIGETMTRKRIYELTRGQCRFPTTPDNAPTHFFCAEPVEGEKAVYCPAHEDVCYDRRSAERRKADHESTAAARAAKAAKSHWGFAFAPKGDRIGANDTVTEHLK